MSNQSHARYLRGGRQSEAFACFAITKCVEGRQRLLDNEVVWSVFRSTFEFLRDQNEIRIIAFCIVPDHYHLLIIPIGTKSLSGIVKSINQHSSKQINQVLDLKGNLWQTGYFDHRCRNTDDMQDRLTYFENNPVRGGLVDKPENWSYSSAHSRNADLLDRDWFKTVR